MLFHIIAYTVSGARVCFAAARILDISWCIYQMHGLVYLQMRDFRKRTLFGKLI